MMRGTGAAVRPAGIAVLTLAIAVCTSVTEPTLPKDAQEFSPPPVYSTWWNMTQACSQLTGSLSAVTWYSTAEVVHDIASGDVIAGYWVAGSNRIVLNSAVMMDGGIVRHEMLHALIKHGGHPRNQFLGNCAGTVDCERACAADAGPYPNPPETPIQVGTESIAISVSVDPTTPTHAVDEGRFSVTVQTHNLTSHWITVTPASGVDALQTSSVDVHGPNGATQRDELSDDPSQRIFAPNETKKQVFDLVIGDYPFGNQLLPGDYVALGAFAGWWNTNNPLQFTINP
ncbi:MAG TPA: hypothetical protein VJS39_00085 [Gemmatimonadaceae bacterium]|nr:hypothetical protein [Gemmatimonadaceae bacterium]